MGSQIVESLPSDIVLLIGYVSSQSVAVNIPSEMTYAHGQAIYNHDVVTEIDDRELIMA